MSGKWDEVGLIGQELVHRNACLLEDGTQSSLCHVFGMPGHSDLVATHFMTPDLMAARPAPIETIPVAPQSGCYLPIVETC